ncbi:MAG: hypothetical protein ACXWQQ_15500 [Pseudobdellovibrio sp.]
MPLRPKNFREDKKYFHMTLTYEVSPWIKDLEWWFIQKLIADTAGVWNFEIQSLVMMDSHLHLISASAFPNGDNFTASLQMFLGSVSPDSHVCEPIKNLSQYLNTYKYVYRNPIEAGLCLRAEDYVYSSLYSLLGKKHMEIAIYDQLGLIQNPFHVLSWLNSDTNYKQSKLSWLQELTP